MKKIVVFLLLLSLFVNGAIALFASENEKADVKALTVLGDSISTGYGLDIYKDEESEQGKPYADIVAEYYGLKKGESYFNYAENGATSDGLFKMLTSLDSEKRENIEKSNAIIVTIGGNDLLAVLVPYLAELIELDATANAEDVLTAFKKFESTDLKNFDKMAQALVKGKEKEIKAFSDKLSENISKIIIEIKKISPNAKIFVQNIYDPTAELAQYKSLAVVRERIVSALIVKANDAISKAVKNENAVLADIYAELSGRKNPCTNMAHLDIHPNANGHKIIADALTFAVDQVISENSGQYGHSFTKGKYTWLYFVGAVAVVALVVPAVVFVTKKVSGK